MKTQTILELSDITKIYAPAGQMELTILKGLNLSIMRGESLAIVGPSGSGKTTLLNIMGGLDRPSSGSVRFQDQDLLALKEAALAQHRNEQVGFIFQLHHLLPQCSVFENVLIPTLAHKKCDGQDERAKELLKRVKLDQRMNHLPGQLSGGERQRVAVVRALINQPTLILADEPTGSLDASATESLATLLAECNREQQTTLVVVTHSSQLADKMDRTLHLTEGRLQP